MLKIGDKFEGLTVLKYCGGGAFGDVYYCHDLSGHRVALKIVSKLKLGDSWRRELKGVISYREVVREVPGLMDIYHVADDEDVFYYTMTPADNASQSNAPCDYVPDTLAFRLQANRISSDVIPDWLEMIFNSIKALHSAGFAHRDIKPENILFVNGRPVLGDIGLMTPLSGTMTQLVGTLDFLPPEWRMGYGSVKDSHSSRCQNDLYAYGKLMYCLATGGDAFDFPTPPLGWHFDHITKHYYHLSLALCDKDANSRLTQIGKIDSRLARIRKKIEQGECLVDRLEYFADDFFRKIHRHWLKFGFAFAVVALLSVWWLWMFKSGQKMQEKVSSAIVPVSAVPTEEPPVVSSSSDASKEADGGSLRMVDIKQESPSITVNRSSGESRRQNASSAVRVPAPVKYEYQFKNKDMPSLFVGDLDMELRQIPAGTFMMGEDADVHQVTISRNFWMGKTEVTIAQWTAIMGDGAYIKLADYEKENGKFPIRSISWAQALLFCEKLNEKYRSILPAGYRFSLPTEAQWEYACRGGDFARKYDLDLLHAEAWTLEDFDIKDYNSSHTRLVGLKRPNGWGLYDMIGNVSEVCLDLFPEPGTVFATVTDPIITNDFSRDFAGYDIYQMAAGKLPPYRPSFPGLQTIFTVVRGGDIMTVAKDSNPTYRERSFILNGRTGFRVAVIPEEYVTRHPILNDILSSKLK